MYGTIAKMHLKPGAQKEIDRLSREWSTEIPGFVFQHVYRMDADQNEFMLVVGFTDKAAYHKNAASPEQAARTAQYMALIDGPPEWHDGEVVMSFPA